MSRRFAACIAAVAVALISASGCGLERAESEEIGESAGESVEAPSPTLSPARTDDGKFTLRYDPDSPMNPFTTASADNMSVSTLLYEGLFALDESFLPVAVLCESYTASQDGASYVFLIKQGVVMSDGDELTAEDVEYSLLRAIESARYSGRLKRVESVSATGDFELSVKLDRPDGGLPALLDIPVIRAGTAGGAAPAGSGPYALSGATLTARGEYRDGAKLPLPVIYLRECGDPELAELFTEREIDLFIGDPVGISSVNVRRDHEIRRYNSTTLQYLGFNSRLAVLDSNLRRAIGLAVDREYIAGTLMYGCALPAPLILSPALYRYDASWEGSQSDPILEISSIFSYLGLADADNDMFLEYPDSPGQYAAFSLDFIVNSESTRKTAAARHIRDSLRRMGLDVVLRELPWDSFTRALADGDFDIYYGETTLPANFDVSELVLPGGDLDFGDVGSSDYSAYIDAFLAETPGVSDGAAAKRLCERVESGGAVAPILYKQYEVHSDRNVISGMRPTQSSVFFMLTDWNVKVDGAGGGTR